MLYQQGDIIFMSTENAKGKKSKKTERGYVVAEGEATGHYHTIKDEIDLLISDSGMFVSSREPFTVTHEEHGPITIPAGDYEVKRVQEYDHFAEEARAVMD